jgi:HEAT repeat protein
MRTIVMMLGAGLLGAVLLGPRPAVAQQRETTPQSTPAAEEIQKLVQQLGDDSFNVRELADDALREIGRPALPALRQALRSPDPEVRRRVRGILESVRLSVENLIDGLKDESEEVRKDAAQRLVRLGPDKARAAVPALAAALKDKDEAVRDAVIGALMAIDPDNKALADVAPAQAHVNGKYAKLLRRLKVPQDRAIYQDFSDYGTFPAIAEYGGYKDIPQGYWVYVYPYWYIWAEQKRQ